jgi:type III pantothenate kinase
VKTLVLDLGNSTLFAGVFRDDKLLRSARIDVGRDRLIPPAKMAALKAGSGDPALQLKKLARGRVDAVALCSVVPKQTEKFIRLVQKTFGLAPKVLIPAANHGLKIAYDRPDQLGPDRLATTLGARKLYPHKNLIVVDCGTATTLTLLSRDGVLLGGAILPGLGLWPAMLARRTARLPEVTLQQPTRVVARDTVGALHSGILHGHAGAIRELIGLSRAEAFGRAPAVVIGTGGLVTHFKGQRLFTALEPGLILHGLQAFAAQNIHHA